MRRPGFIFLAMLLAVSCAETGMRDVPYTDALQAKIINDPELPWQWNYHNDASLAKGDDIFAAGGDIYLFEAEKQAQK